MNTSEHRTSNISRLLLIGAVMAVITGCAGSGSMGPLRDISYPPVNAPSTAYLGERLLEQGQGLKTDVIKVHALKGKFVQIQGEMFCRKPGTDEFVSFNGYAVTFLNFLGGARSYSNKLTFKQNKGQVCFSDMWSGCFGGNKSSFEYITDTTCAYPNALQQVIEYNGKEGNTLNFTYRTFYGKNVMDDNTQDFKMDLSLGDTFNYKGARIQIERATNQEISYRVLKNFAL